MATRVHPTAIVSPEARLGHDVVLGPYAVVGAGAVLGDCCELHAHAIVNGPTDVGPDTVVHSFAVVGGAPQQKKDDGGRRATLTMGARNVVREHATIHRGSGARDSEPGGTRVGDSNLFMVGCHVAHDVQLGSHVTLANGTQVAGHAIVEDHATFGGLSGVAQFVRVGESAFVAAGAMCERPVPPFVIVQGDRARIRALNVVGLRRRGVPEPSIERLAAAFRRLFAGDEPREAALAHVDTSDPYVERLVAALRRG